MLINKYKVPILTLINGILLVAMSYVYDRSVSSIGVNFGAAFIWMFGILIIVISLVIFVYIAVADQKDNKKKLAILLLAAGLAIAVFGIATADISNLSEVERIHGCNSKERIIKPDTYCENLKNAPEAKIKYLNTLSSAGMLLTVGSAVYLLTSKR
jgi:hypothetical protein